MEIKKKIYSLSNHYAKLSFFSSTARTTQHFVGLCLEWEAPEFAVQLRRVSHIIFIQSSDFFFQNKKKLHQKRVCCHINIPSTVLPNSRSGPWLKRTWVSNLFEILPSLKLHTGWYIFCGSDNTSFISNSLITKRKYKNIY